MPEDCPCETLWTRNPAALLGTNLLVDDVCESDNINAFTRAVLLGLALASILAPMLGLFGLGLVLLAILMLYGRWLFAKVNVGARTVEVEAKRPKTKEGFLSGLRPVDPKLAAELVTSPAATVRNTATAPSAGNPFMNVLIDEITYNPTRPPAENVSDPNNVQILDDYFRIQWKNDPTDVFGRSQSQRQFYTTPSTSIPNDQGSYQNWLYLIPGKTCKEGGRDACVPGTNGGVVPWLNQPN
jgi:hypothetical protein